MQSPHLALAAFLAVAGIVSAFLRPLASDGQLAPPEHLAPVLPDLNRSPPHRLLLLPGIGPARAAAIVEDREARGVFETVDDVQRVSGIGPKTVAGLRGLATAAGRASLSPARGPRDPPAANSGAASR